MGYSIVQELPYSGGRNRFRIFIDGGEETLPEIVDKTTIARTSEAISVLTRERWVLNSVWKWQKSPVKVNLDGSDSGSSDSGSSDSSGTITLTPATSTNLGGIMVGDYLSVTSTGKLSVKADTTVTENSESLITSGAVYKEIGDLSTVLKSI